MKVNLRSSTLGVICHKRLWSDPEGIKTMGGFGRQIEEISRYFRKIILVVPFEKRPNPKPGYILQIDNLEIVPLSYYDGNSNRGKLGFLAKAPKITKTIWDAYGKCDFVHFRLPGYVGILGTLVHKVRKNNAGFIWIGTDWVERILKTSDTWSRRILARIADVLIPWLIQDTCTFAVGKLVESYHMHPYVYPVKTTVVSKENILSDRTVKISSPPQLLYVGRLAPEKGIPYLIKAMKLCKENGNSYHLTIVGDGSKRDDLEEMVTESGLTGHVTFLGYIPLGKALWQQYQQADLFVFPSLSEGQPKVLVEAMASGLPIIATMAGGIPSIIQDGYNGLLVPPKSPEALCKAIQQVIKDTKLFGSLQKNALESVKELTIEKQTQKMIRRFEKTILEKTDSNL